MAKVAPIQNSYNAGELSPLINGRIDLREKYENGCETLQNFIPTIQGPARKRPGTRYVGAVKNAAHNTHLIPFQHSITQAYVLEFGDQYIRFYRDGGRILETAVNITGATAANPVVITAPSHGYSNGDFVYIASVGGMTELNGMCFTVANATATTFELSGIDGTAYTAYTSGGTVSRVYEISTPYLHTEIADIHYAQSADVLYITHSNHPPQKLARLAHDSWTLTEVDFDWPPFNDENTETTTITASATTGTGITLTASAATFNANHVGTYFKLSEVIESKYDLWEAGKAVSSGDFRVYDGRLYKADGAGTTGARPPIHEEGSESDGTVSWTFQHDGDGYAEITGYTSTTVVTADVIKQLPESALTPGTKKWSEGAWSDSAGWPITTAFYEDRLWFAGSTSKPQTLWASTSGDYESHKPGTEDDDALNYTINAQELNPIQWLSPGKVLVIGTSGGEFVMTASSPESAITPTDVRIVPHTGYGSIGEQPLRIGNAVIFVQRSQKKLREFVYTFESDAYVAPDLTILSENITGTGVSEMAYQQEPHQVIWTPRADGQLAALTYERTEDVVAWHRHTTLNGSFKSVATVPHWDNQQQDVLWVIVERTVNSQTVKYVEYMDKYMIDDYAFFVDAGLTYDGSPATTISGFDHLEGETISLLVDGYIHPDRTVSNGSITLQAAGSIVTGGLKMTGIARSMPIEAGAQNGVAAGKPARINEVVFRLLETGPGLKYGPDVNNLDEYNMRVAGDLMDEPVPLFTGDTGKLPWPAGYEQQAHVTAVHDTPLPCTLVASMPQVTVYDR